MKRKISYSMKGILNVATGEIVHTDKNGVETVHDYKKLLESLDGQEITLKIDHIEYLEEDDDEEGCCC